MLNRYPLWKYFLILALIVLGFVYALPTLYPDDPAVQITGSDVSQKIDSSVLTKAEQALKANNIAVKAVSIHKGAALIRLTKSEDQLPAKQDIREALGSDYIVALNLASTTPAWLKAIGAGPMKLGLDLSGGVHFLLEVDTNKAIQTRLDVASSEIRTLLRKQRLRYRIEPSDSKLIAKLAFQTADIRDRAYQQIHKKFADLQLTKGDDAGKFAISYQMSPQSVKTIEQYAIQQNLTTVRNRVNELGVSEPLVQRQGANHIVVELPGVQDTAEAKRILGKTANLEFRLAAPYGAPAGSYQTFHFRSNPAQTANLSRDILLTGNHVTNAQFSYNQQDGQPLVNITLDSQGGQRMLRTTRSNVGRQMSVLYLEQKPITTMVTKTVNGKQVREPETTFRSESSIISLATIQGVFGNNFQITGLSSPAEASELALLLRSGALAAPMHFVEESTIGPSMGKENIRMGIESTVIGLLLVLVFMILCYRRFGWIANVALLLNLVILVALMSVIGATLTMPGIAGIVLTLGMAVDANVLINSRIREEYRRGVSPQKAIFEGYNRAFVSVFDANITTLIAGIILYAVGTGSVKGFAVTLSLGIVTSMFTAIMVSRALVNVTYGRSRRLKHLKI